MSDFRLLPYEAVTWRQGSSFCPACMSSIRLVRPKDPMRALDMPCFFVCSECSYIGQVGVEKLWPTSEKKG